MTAASVIFLLIATIFVGGITKPYNENLSLAQVAGMYLSELNVTAASITTGDVVHSPNGTFILSFRKFTNYKNASYYYLAISFGVSPDSHPVWTANRDNPVSDAATLRLDTTGNLLLYDSISGGKKSVIWSSGAPRSNQVAVWVAKLQDSGNFVLRKNDSETDIWRSFDHPTDTLLPDQVLTPPNILQCKSGNANLKSGRFAFSFGESDNSRNTSVQLVHFAGQSEYRYWGDVSSIPGKFYFDKLGNMTFNASIVTMMPTDYGQSSDLRRLTIDVDGNLRMYSWNKDSLRWDIAWYAINDICVLGLNICGDYGICINRPQPTCVCPPGLSPVSPDLVSGGCSGDAIYRASTNCSSEDLYYVRIDSIDYFTLDVDVILSNSSEQQCKEKCSADCKCIAARHSRDGSGSCWLISRLINGYRASHGQGITVFLKYSANYNISRVANITALIANTATDWSYNGIWGAYNVAPYADSPSAATNEDDRNRSSVIIVTALLSSIIGVLLLFSGSASLLFLSYRRQLTYLKLRGEEIGSPAVFTYYELDVATKGFTEKLGEGGFGSVYKGKLPNGKLVAVKKLNGLSSDDCEQRQFKTEIATIGRIHHVNLLRLVGFCDEEGHKLLVYEYMENGSLDRVLFPRESTSSFGEIKVLDWATRYKICISVAKGIHYLHDECLQCILHCDIKPENILLDKQYSPKVADFGLAYLYSRGHTIKMSTIRGTRGYMAPEWSLSMPITTKADVYSYGMLVLEIISGRRNFQYNESAIMNEDNNWWCFPMWAFGRTTKDVIDPRLAPQQDEPMFNANAKMDQVPLSNHDASSTISSDPNWDQVESLMKVAFLCIQNDIQARPTMTKVIQMLEGTLPIPNDVSPFTLPCT